MAIEVFPKPKTKKIPLVNFFFYILLVVFLAFLASYFILDFYQKKLTEEISQLNKNLERSPAEKNLEDAIFSYQKKIADMGNLLSSHRLMANLFDHLEKITHPKVQIVKFRLVSESDVIDLSGLTDSFEILGQQTMIFEKQDFIKNVNLVKVAINKDGKINFDLRLGFDEKIFNPLVSP